MTSLFPFPQRSGASSPEKMEDTQDSNPIDDAAALTPALQKKGRALSDTPPVLLPSPKLSELAQSSKDDISLIPSKIQSPRPALSTRGLSLQMPPYASPAPPGLAAARRVPLSPKLDASHTYGSPASVLPRRSRGLDFSRACTNLHHSTLAEQSSPDSSPTLTGRPVGTPNRRSFQNPWGSHPYQSTWPVSGPGERNSMASSIGSVNMLGSDSEKSSSDTDEDMDAPDHEDPILGTPQVHKLFVDPAFGKSATTASNTTTCSPGGDWMGHYSPAARSLLSFRRGNSNVRRPRKESSSASISGGSSMPSPGAASPAAMKGVEGGSNYFAREWPGNGRSSRRASLTMGTSDLHLSSGGESDEGGSTVAGTPREKRGVIKRVVTRRGNLLPKTKNFARIKAALMEEGAPVDNEVKREAEVVRQVREREPDLHQREKVSTMVSANSAAALGLNDPLESESGDEIGRTDTLARGLDRFPSQTFTMQAKRLSGGKEFWETFDARTRTPPPPVFPRASSLAISDDMPMDSPTAATPISIPGQAPICPELSLKSSRSSQSSTTHHPMPQPSAEEISQKIKRKRARDDDFDPSSFKRRAVSPGVSVQNSPVLAESPSQRDGGWWGVPLGGRDAWLPSSNSNGNGNGKHAAGAGGRTNSVSSSTSGSVRRIGFQGMNDTNDGLQKMSIE